MKIAEKMALNEGNWVPWPVSSMKLLKQSDKTNACGMKTMECIANPRFIFTTKKKSGGFWGKSMLIRIILKWRCHGDLQKLIISTIFVILLKLAIKQATSGDFLVELV